MSLGTLVFNIVFIALVLGFLLFIGWLLWLFFTGRQRRGRAQSAVFGEFPPVPADPKLSLPGSAFAIARSPFRSVAGRLRRASST